MKILVYDNEGMSTSLAHRLYSIEGEDVKFLAQKDEGKEHLEGIVPLAKSLEEGLRWVGEKGLVICGDEQDVSEIRSQGFRVYGGNKITQKLENDRSFEMETATKLGVRIPKFHAIESVDEAISFIKKHPDQYVLKQTGHAPKTWSCVGKHEDGSDIIDQLEWMKNQPEFSKLSKTPFILQEFCYGIEFSVSGFWAGKDWLRNEDGSLILCLTKENKKALRNDAGLTTGEMGSNVMMCEESRLFDEMLDKWTPWLRENASDARINFDTNCILVEEDGDMLPYLLECTPRSGYPFSSAFEHMMVTPQAEFFSMLVDAQNKGVEYKYGWCTVTVLGCGHFPIENKNHEGSFKDQPVIFPFGLDDWDDHFAPLYIKYDRSKEFFRVADYYEMICTVSHCDDDPTVANKQCVNDMESVDVRAPFYRDDIGDKFKTQMKDLKDFGYIPDQMTKTEYNRTYGKD